jgi:hypothetical protein
MLWTHLNLSNLKSSCNSIKRIKSARSDHGSEYYGRSDGSGEQRLEIFAKFLQNNGIVP